MNHVLVERETQCFKGGCCPSFWEDEMRLLCEQNMFLVDLHCVISSCPLVVRLLGESHAERSLHTLAIARVYSPNTLGLVLAESGNQSSESIFDVVISRSSFRPGGFSLRRFGVDFAGHPGTAWMPFS